MINIPLDHYKRYHEWRKRMTTNTQLIMDESKELSIQFEEFANNQIAQANDPAIELDVKMRRMHLIKAALYFDMAARLEENYGNRDNERITDLFILKSKAYKTSAKLGGEHVS